MLTAVFSKMSPHQNGSGKADSGRVNVADQNNGLIELIQRHAAQFETVTMGSTICACLAKRAAAYCGGRGVGGYRGCARLRLLIRLAAMSQNQRLARLL